jgi:ribonuclease BN (tRNA processing enzyme)
LEIRFLGTHNAETKNTKLASFLIDNIIAVDAGSLTTELSYKQQEKIKAILISHGHYDHIKAIPAFAFNNPDKTTPVYASNKTLEILSSNLVDGIIYPNFTKKNSFLKKPSLKFIELKSLNQIDIGEYQVKAVSVNHPLDALGFEITSKDGKKIFYTGDTGSGLSNVWKQISADILIIEVSFPNRFETAVKNAKHLCPILLKTELIDFKKINGYLPQIYVIHMNSKLEGEIKKEVNTVANELSVPINYAIEGKSINI